MARKSKIPGLSFSWKRATGLSAAKGKLSRQLGFPLTRAGRQRKVGRALGCAVVPIAVAVILFAAGCATSSLTPEAQRVTVTSSAADVEGCRLLGTVESSPPYVMPGDAVNELRNEAGALGADTLLLTSHGVSRGKTGAAYRCRP